MATVPSFPASVLAVRGPGLALAAAIGTAGLWLAQQPLLQRGQLGALTVAIVIGMLVGNLGGARLPAALAPGLALAQRHLLRAGVVLYGLRLSFQDVAALGLSGLLVDAVVVAGTLALGLWAGRRWFGLDRDTALLTAAGSAICGAAAVLAVERVIRPEPGKVAMAVASVVLFGTLGIFLYPALYPHLGLDAAGFGLYAGATVHEVAQVVAVGSAIGPETADAAVVAKLSRVLMLVPVLLLLGWREARRSGGHEVAVPWFALGFLAMVAVNSLVPVPAAVKSWLLALDTLLLATAMAALGVETRLSRLRALGTRPLLLAALLFAWLSVGGYLLVRLLH
ncbi:YeiH family protein [Vulcaniibacterium tengchongense]|uniref:Putative integral membrane protein (TIGR00698 family) n=1 Tax=Vulcaniibacterium tengchongense TaxID=1273429 RepID=A0A3N4VRB9_9GAMM|nr:YeiH family protein [Vulcaniibacterium tengchongense]RPE81761.1 putative integral membrane protein (TIGR00698 family) [Vulcaniibacterium tengchongense]